MKELRRKLLHSNLPLLVIPILSVVLRLLLTHPIATPDSQTYLALADNLVQHGCYSTRADCVPTWATEPPGYPIFIAMFSALAGFYKVVLFQTLLLAFGISLFYLLYVASRLFGPNFGGAVLIAISPLTVGWSQYLLTETLAAAAAMYVLAECIKSLIEERFRVVGIAVSMAIATIIRWDLITLSALVLPVALHLHSLPQAFRKADIAVEWLIGAPAGMSLEPGKFQHGLA